MARITPAAAPPAGTVQPGNLYIDLATKTIWLGVDPSVDVDGVVDGVVLISDLYGTLAAVDAAESDANAYTNTKVAPLAPLNNPVFTGDPQRAPPPLLASDNDQSLATTAYVKAQAAAIAPSIWVPGMVVAWSGKIADILTALGPSWCLCDGRELEIATYPKLNTNLGGLYNSPTPQPGNFRIPDLKNRFIVGGGDKESGTKNAATQANVVGDGAHGHTVDGTAITAAQTPVHQHAHGTLKGVANGDTAVAGTHTHDVLRYQSQGAAQAGPYPGVWVGGVTVNSGAAEYSGVGASGADHFHDITNVPVVINAGNTGNMMVNTTAIVGGQKHTHTIAATGGGHSHKVNGTDVLAAMPFFTLCYVIRLN